MHTLKLNKKILLLLYLIFFSSNALASDNLKKLDHQIQFPLLTILNSNEEPLILEFDKDTKKIGYVINFWATWCIPCKKELPDLSLLGQKLKKSKVDVITISIDKKKIKDQIIFLNKNGASNLIHFFDKKMNIFKALNLRGIPTTILVDKNGLVISKHEGSLKWSEDKIVKEITKLFN